MTTLVPLGQTSDTNGSYYTNAIIGLKAAGGACRSESDCHPGYSGRGRRRPTRVCSFEQR